MQKNETIIYREYRTIVDDLWDLNQAIYEQKDGKEKQSLVAQYKELNKQSDEYAMEIKKDIIIPSLDKNADEEQIKKGFSNWCTTWAEYIDNMTDEEFDAFVTAENKYYDTDGKSQEIENFRPSKIFTNKKSEPSMNM